MGILGIIPARYGSTRLPGKPMIKVKGKTIIQRVYERVARSTLLSRAIVATDDVRIYNHVIKFGGEAIMTNQQHRSGTSRCGEVIRQIADARIIINIQGDEPLINSGEVDRLARFMAEDATRKIGTMVKKLDRLEDLEDPSVAKVVLDQNFRALYFSRSPIPFVRNYPREQWLEHATFYKHIGMYAYRRETLEELVLLAPGSLEETELLEQLNWLYHGYPIYALETEVESLGIDTAEDVALLEHILGLADN